MNEHDKSARMPLLFLALGVFLVSSHPTLAARLVRFDVSIDGKRVLETSRGDNGRQNADTMWLYLKDLSLRPLRGYKVEPDSMDPLRATLKGKVIIESYGGRAEVSQLKLVR